MKEPRNITIDVLDNIKALEKIIITYKSMINNNYRGFTINNLKVNLCSKTTCPLCNVPSTNKVCSECLWKIGALVDADGYTTLDMFMVSQADCTSTTTYTALIYFRNLFLSNYSWWHRNFNSEFRKTLRINKMIVGFRINMYEVALKIMLSCKQGDDPISVINQKQKQHEASMYIRTFIKKFGDC